MPRAVLTAICLATLTAAPSAQALTLEQCNRAVLSHHFYEGDHRDIGNGLVLYSSSASVDGHASGRWNITDCRSGRELTLRAYSCDLSDKTCAEGYDDSDRIEQGLLDAVAAEESYRLDDLPALLGLSRDRFVLDQSDTETCGCRAAYPHLRRGKERFVLEDW
jgi:hypothetical protein